MEAIFTDTPTCACVGRSVMAESLVTENDCDETEAKLQSSVEDSPSGLSRTDITETSTKNSSEVHTQTEIVHAWSTSNSPLTRMPVLGEVSGFSLV